jgi:hypothetical protein
MARAGLYKTEVQKARDSLIAQGKHPSVDAVRVALGNTGSKSTIHRYLKELEAESGALNLESRGQIGTTEGTTIKLTFPFGVQPWESSDEAYERYKELCRTNKVIRGLGPDCDSAPALWRTWMIPQFPNRDLLEVAFEAWTLLGELLSGAVEAFGGEKLDLSMPCRHDPALIRIRRFSQHEFFLSVDGVDLKEDERRWRERSLTDRAL